MKTTVKMVGASGQISLGKEYAGRQVLVEVSGPGVWTIRTATVVPDNERWLHNQEVVAGLSRALAWAAEHPVQPSDLGEIKRRLRNGETDSAKRERAKSQGRSQQSRVSRKLAHT